MPITYTCLIVDDEPLAQELIAAHVAKIPELKVIGFCGNALEASSILAHKKVDLLFLDINMPVLKGIDFFKNLMHKPQVIFTTAYREYAVEGFEVNALDYLLKPIIFDRFFLAVQRFFKKMQSNAPILQKVVEPEETLFVNQGHRKIKINLPRVIYIESFKDYIEIHQNQHQTIRIKENIGVIEQKLSNNFLRIHRSYIINTKYLTGFTKLDVELDQLQLPIGPSYRVSVLGYFEV